MDLSNGSDFVTLKGDKKLEIIDTPSIYILTRSILESFLTLEYLFFNKLYPNEISAIQFVDEFVSDKARTYY